MGVSSSGQALVSLSTSELLLVKPKVRAGLWGQCSIGPGLLKQVQTCMVVRFAAFSKGQQDPKGSFMVFLVQHSVLAMCWDVH